MSSNGAEWAKKVLAAFKDADLATDDEVEAAGGPSDTTLNGWRKVASGEVPALARPRNPTMRKVERAAKWAGGEAGRLWDDPNRTPVSAATQDADYVSSPGTLVEGGVSNAEVLRAIREMQDEQRRMSQRLEQLEQRGTESLGGTEGSS